MITLIYINDVLDLGDCVKPAGHKARYFACHKDPSEAIRLYRLLTIAIHDSSFTERKENKYSN